MDGAGNGAGALDLPPNQPLDFVTAASFILTYGTGDHALRDRGGLRPGETLLVLGAAGGVGIAAIEIGKALGAHVIACASADDKLAVCREHGADETINYQQGDFLDAVKRLTAKRGVDVVFEHTGEATWETINYATEDLRERIKGLTGGRGIDVVYDPVGGPYAEPALRSVGWRGRFLVIGFASGDIPKMPLNLPLVKGSSIVGVYWGDFTRREPQRFAESMQQLGRWYAEGRLKPHVSATFPLERASEALTLMANRQVKGKVVLTTC